ncbi:hypothetical protein ACDA63_19135 [Uliginosibacterium sp. sgz301328]
MSFEMDAIGSELLAFFSNSTRPESISCTMKAAERSNGLPSLSNCSSTRLTTFLAVTFLAGATARDLVVAFFETALLAVTFLEEGFALTVFSVFLERLDEAACTGLAMPAMNMRLKTSAKIWPKRMGTPLEIPDKLWEL